MTRIALLAPKCLRPLGQKSSDKYQPPEPCGRLFSPSEKRNQVRLICCPRSRYEAWLRIRLLFLLKSPSKLLQDRAQRQFPPEGTRLHSRLETCRESTPLCEFKRKTWTTSLRGSYTKQAFEELDHRVSRRRTTEITGLRQVNSPSENARPATPVHFIVRRVLGYCNEVSHSRCQLDQSRSGRLIRKS